MEKKLNDCKDSRLKDALWEKQAAIMDRDPAVLKVWYKSLRTRYGRLKKMPSGSGLLDITERDKWILLSFDFLSPYIAEMPRRQLVSVSAIFILIYFILFLFSVLFCAIYFIPYSILC